jgi:hypothetical protein
MSSPTYKENNVKLAGHEDEYYVLIYVYSHIIMAGRGFDS